MAHLRETITDKKRQELVDRFTNEVLTEEFGERFKNLDNIEDDEDINKIWETLNERFYDAILNSLYLI
jgi:hypothetical protein